jgi:hypothetical protein
MDELRTRPNSEGIICLWNMNGNKNIYAKKQLLMSLNANIMVLIEPRKRL